MQAIFSLNRQFRNPPWEIILKFRLQLSLCIENKPGPAQVGAISKLIHSQSYNQNR